MLKETELRELGRELLRMRKEMRMTLEEVAEELGTDFRVISRYENGKAEIGALMYRKLVRLYEQRTKQNDLLQQVKNLSPTQRAALEALISSMKAG